MQSEFRNWNGPEDRPPLEQRVSIILNFRFQTSDWKFRNPHSTIEGSVSSWNAMRYLPHTLCEYLREAEVGKPKSNWELQGILGLAVFVLGFLTGR